MTAARWFNEVYMTAAASETTIFAASLIYIPEREVCSSSCSVVLNKKRLLNSVADLHSWIVLHVPGLIVLTPSVGPRALPWSAESFVDRVS
jgi:hypothetical protein